MPQCHSNLEHNDSKWMNQSWRVTVLDKLLQFFKAPWVVRAPPLSHANPQCHLWCLRWQVLSSGRVFHRKSFWHLPNLAVILFHIGLLTLWLESWWTLPSVKKLSRCLFHPFSSFTIFVHLIILVFRIQCPRLPKRWTFCSSSYDSGTSWAVKYKISMRNSIYDTRVCWAIIWHIVHFDKDTKIITLWYIHLRHLRVCTILYNKHQIIKSHFGMTSCQRVGRHSGIHFVTANATAAAWSA